MFDIQGHPPSIIISLYTRNFATEIYFYSQNCGFYTLYKTNI